MPNAFYRSLKCKGSRRVCHSSPPRRHAPSCERELIVDETTEDGEPEGILRDRHPGRVEGPDRVRAPQGEAFISPAAQPYHPPAAIPHPHADHLKDVTPKTAENFRQLCTGEKGSLGCHGPARPASQPTTQPPSPTPPPPLPPSHLLPTMSPPSASPSPPRRLIASHHTPHPPALAQARTLGRASPSTLRAASSTASSRSS